MEFDALPLYSNYQMSGRILSIPIEGKGFLAATVGKLRISFFHKTSLIIFQLGPLSATIRIEGKLVDVDGVKYYNTTNIKVTESIKGLEIAMQGLFGGDKELGICNFLLNILQLLNINFRSYN